MNKLHDLVPRFLLAWLDRIVEKAQVYLLSIELFRRSDRAKMTARWDAKSCNLFMHSSLALVREK